MTSSLEAPPQVAIDDVVTGHVIEVVKGGLILDIGLRGFLPASLVEMRRFRALQPYVGRELEAKIIELDKNQNKVVLPRRAWLEQTQSEVRQTFLTTLQKGQVRKGVVSSIVNFGAFVDLGGVDGLVHVSELSWKHIDHPSEVVEVGQEVEVEVLDVDLDRERVSLSLKAAVQDQTPLAGQEDELALEEGAYPGYEGEYAEGAYPEGTYAEGEYADGSYVYDEQGNPIGVMPGTAMAEAFQEAGFYEGGYDTEGQPVEGQPV